MDEQPGNCDANDNGGTMKEDNGHRVHAFSNNTQGRRALDVSVF